MEEEKGDCGGRKINREMMEEMTEKMRQEINLSQHSWAASPGIWLKTPLVLCLCGPNCLNAPATSCFFRDPIRQQEPGLWDQPQVPPVHRVQSEGLFLPQWHDHYRSQYHRYQWTSAQIPPASVQHKGLRECHRGGCCADSKNLWFCPVWVGGGWVWTLGVGSYLPLL